MSATDIITELNTLTTTENIDFSNYNSLYANDKTFNDKQKQMFNTEVIYYKQTNSPLSNDKIISEILMKDVYFNILNKYLHIFMEQKKISEKLESNNKVHEYLNMEGLDTTNNVRINVLAFIYSKISNSLTNDTISDVEREITDNKKKTKKLLRKLKGKKNVNLALVKKQRLLLYKLTKLNFHFVINKHTSTTVGNTTYAIYRYFNMNNIVSSANLPGTTDYEKFVNYLFSNTDAKFIKKLKTKFSKRTKKLSKKLQNNVSIIENVSGKTIKYLKSTDDKLKPISDVTGTITKSTFDNDDDFQKKVAYTINSSKSDNNNKALMYVAPYTHKLENPFKKSSDSKKINNYKQELLNMETKPDELHELLNINTTI